MIKKSLFGTFYFVSFFISPMVLLFDWIYYLGDYVCAGIGQDIRYPTYIFYLLCMTFCNQQINYFPDTTLPHLLT